MSYEIHQGSAVFRYGMSDPAQLEDWLEDNQEAVGICFVGRSNVGKSSLINTIFGKKTARVSNTPGRTREINIFEFNLKKDGKPDPDFPPVYLFDLPGYGHAQVSKKMAAHWGVLMGTLFERCGSKFLMVNIQDARHPNQKSDQEFHDWLQNFESETYLAFNKIDKLKRQKERAALNKIKPLIYKEYRWVKQIFFLSAETKAGVKDFHDSLINFILEKTQD